MMKNYMADVAKMIGVKLGEEFDIEPGCTDPYEFTEYYCTFSYKLTKNGLLNCCDEEDNKVLSMLLTGEAKVIKKPWKPKERDIYYYINTDGTISHKIFCSKSEVDLANVLLGNFFKTAGDAEVNSKKWLERIKQEPDISWRVDNETR